MKSCLTSTTGSRSAAQPASPHIDTRDAGAGSAEQPVGQNPGDADAGAGPDNTIEVSSDEERKCGIPGLPDNYTSGDDSHSDESVDTCRKRRKLEEIQEGKERRAARKAKLQEAASSRSARANTMDRPRDFTSTPGSSSAAQPASPHVDTRDAGAGSAEQPTGAGMKRDQDRPRDFANLQVGDRLEGTRLTRMWSQRAPDASSELLFRGGQLQGVEFVVAEVDRQEDYTQVKTEVASMHGWVRIWSRWNKAGCPTGVQFVSAARPVK